MNSTEKTESSKTSPKPAPSSSQWLNPRGLRFWAVAIIVLYTLSGFFLLPYLVKDALVNFVNKDLGRSARVEKVSFNPYTFKFAVEGFELFDTDEVKLLGFEKFVINFQLSSLFRWAWTFEEISLSAPYFFFERFSVEENRISRLSETLVSEETSPEEEPANASMPRLLIHNLTITNGQGQLIDRVPASPVDLNIGPIDITIKALNTLPNRDGQQEVSISLPDHAHLHWNGSIKLTPFESSGQLELKNLRLDKISAYLKTFVLLDELQAALSTRFNYRVQVVNEVFEARIDELDTTLDSLSISGLSPSTELLSIPRIVIKDGALRYPEQIVHVGSLSIEQAHVKAWLDERSRLNFLNLIPASNSKPNSKAQVDNTSAGEQFSLGPAERQAPGSAQITSEPVLATEQIPWQFALDQFSIKGANVDFSDRSINPPGAIGLRDLQVELSGLNNQQGSRFPFSVNTGLATNTEVSVNPGLASNGQIGQINIDGELGVFPSFSLNAATQIQDLPLAIAQAYAQQSAQISIDGGTLDSEINISLRSAPETQEPVLTIKGSAQIPDLDIKDSANKKPLIGWQNLDIDDFHLDLQANNLNISKLQFEQPYGRFLIHEDGATNISDLVVERIDDSSTTAPSPENEPENESEKPGPQTKKSKTVQPMQVALGGISINDAIMDFADLSLPLPFATLISKLNGNVSAIATNSSQAAKINLEGQVDKHGQARINGTVNLLDPIRHTDIKFEFRNLKMANVSPYSAEFAGRIIDDGTLDVDLEYAIDQGKMVGKNNLVLSDFLLGEKIESPNATSLPLDLAIALLKDGDGVIKANLPVSGDVNDPEFAIGGVIWDAFVTLITKAVSAPFKLLGGLIGLESDDLGQLQFLAGRADLSPPELEKIANLEQALLQRPELGIEINGAADAMIDVPALQQTQLNGAILQRLGDDNRVSDKKDNKDIVDLASIPNNKVLDILEDLFKERFADISLKIIKTEHKAPPADNPEGKATLDELAYSADLRKRLLTTEIVDEQALAELAQARALAIQNAFLANDQLDPRRLIIGEVKAVKSDDAEWVILELALAL